MNINEIMKALNEAFDQASPSEKTLLIDSVYGWSLDKASEINIFDKPVEKEGS